MFTGLKNFAITKALKKIAADAAVNTATNWIAVGIMAAVGAGADWVLIFQFIGGSHNAQGLHETVRIASCILGAILMFLTGKFPGLRGWVPVIEEVIQEAAKEAEITEAKASGPTQTTTTTVVTVKK